MARRCSIRTLALALAAAAWGCGGEPIAGPPQIRLGRDECAECGMIINEDRYSASMVVDDRGDRKPLLFDDIGDMLDHERFNPGLRVLDRYVHDQPTRAWIEAATAHYIRSEQLHTPMGSGLAAFRNITDAQNLAASESTPVMTYKDLVEFRRKWMEDRYGKPENPKSAGTELPAPTPTPAPDRK
jgi:copper chaperone NosL